MAPEDTPSGGGLDDVTSLSPHVPDDKASSAARRHLLVFSGTSSWLYQLPASGTVVIGRAQTADLRIEDRSASRHHAQLTVKGDAVSISDLNSQNGTFVNGEKLAGDRVLATGDQIVILGTTIILHASTTPVVISQALDGPRFASRIGDEIDRAIRYERTLSLACLLWPAPVDRGQVERVLTRQLRRIDAFAWHSDRSVHVLLAEVGRDIAQTISKRVMDALAAHPDVRIGLVSCPQDGADADALIASAYNAAQTAKPGEIAATGTAHQTLTIGDAKVIVADPACVRLYALIERLAPVDLPVLITGETGCGKELAARAIHALSRRRGRALVSLNCAAIQETLVESELFGHERGAFSGAVASKLGLLEAATESTLFLDEVGELSLTVQAKLLRVLETSRVTRVGDTREREVHVRIVAATNRDLEADIAAGRFRQDLYFRLSGAALHLPPLRDRPRELRLLTQQFLDEACTRTNRAAMTISEPAMQLLLSHTWPGNVRELRNLIQYIAAAYADNVVLPQHIKERWQAAPQSPTPEPAAAAAAGGQPFRPIADEIRELEIGRIRAALEATGGNQTKAAQLLSMPLRTFFDRIKAYNLSPRKGSK